MAQDDKTTKKRPKKPFVGNEGVTFSKENQPSPEAKKAGWKEWREKRMLTQMIANKMAEGTTLEEYYESLLKNAKLGNPKAIETINKGIEEQTDNVTIKHQGIGNVTFE